MAESITTYPQFGQDIAALIPLMKSQSNYVVSIAGSSSGSSAASVSKPHSESATIWVIQCIVSHSAYANYYNASESSFVCIIPIDVDVYLGEGANNYSLYVTITSSQITLKSTHKSIVNGTIIATPIY